MLNEISFQRKQEFNTYSQPIQSEQTKTIYDFVLRQDNQIKLLEKEINCKFFFSSNILNTSCLCLLLIACAQLE